MTFEEEVREYGKLLPTYNPKTNVMNTATGGWVGFELWVARMLNQPAHILRKERKDIKQLLPILRQIEKETPHE